MSVAHDVHAADVNYVHFTLYTCMWLSSHHLFKDMYHALALSTISRRKQNETSFLNMYFMFERKNRLVINLTRSSKQKIENFGSRMEENEQNFLKICRIKAKHRGSPNMQDRQNELNYSKSSRGPKEQLDKPNICQDRRIHYKNLPKTSRKRSKPNCLDCECEKNDASTYFLQEGQKPNRKVPQL
jgi:hypothetical protein